jgi:Flp pilus assembly protein TadD
MSSEFSPSSFDLKVANAKAALRSRDFQQARIAIADAMGLNMDAPEPHNLLGILYEMLGDFQAARKHYRAGYALDPVYKPCCRNLERITGFDGAPFINTMVFDASEIEPERVKKPIRTAMKR